MANARQTTVVRFGVYELDLAARQLRKNGARIKLQDQPFRVLQLLTERPGEIVTREELREKLWPADTFVEFDHSLNTTIQKIRQALGDSPNVPRYVETIPRTGYRFVAPVEAARAQPLPPEPKPAPLGTSLGLTVGALGVLAALAGWWIIRSPEPAFEHTSDRPLRRLTSDQGLAYQPALSSDGKLLAYASDRGGEGNLDIWVQQIGAGAPARLTTDEADETEPSFSPDAARIVFRSGRDGGGIYSVPTLGGEQPRLIAPHGRRPRYSPDGNWIAYWVGSESNVPGSIYLIGAAGGESKELASGRSPIWSPDSRHVLFTRGRTALQDDWYVVSLDGGDPQPTGAFEPLFQQHFRPAVEKVFIAETWHPSGDAVVFSARRSDSTNLWRIPLSPESRQVKGPPSRLTHGTGTETQASFAADGSLVFSTLVENFDIWALPVDSDRGLVIGEIAPLTRNEAVDWYPSISADGTRMVF